MNSHIAYGISTLTRKNRLPALVEPHTVSVRLVLPSTVYKRATPRSGDLDTEHPLLVCGTVLL
jgi:hypothetical protein